MKVSYKLLVPAFLAGLLLIGCGQQDVATPVENAADAAVDAAAEVTEAAGEMAADAADATVDAGEAVAEAVSNEPGGYVPTDDERVPGETR